jgi:hypothetical protein
MAKVAVSLRAAVPSGAVARLTPMPRRVTRKVADPYGVSLL